VNNTHGLTEGEMTMFGYLTEMDDAVGKIVQALHDAQSFADTVMIVSGRTRELHHTAFHPDLSHSSPLLSTPLHSSPLLRSSAAIMAPPQRARWEWTTRMATISRATILTAAGRLRYGKVVLV
jgi:hypothetical protein